MITKKDIELIQTQCENQKATSPSQVAGFACAYFNAKMFALNKGKSVVRLTELIDFVDELASLIEPRNEKGYRKVPVTFRSGGFSLPPGQIESAMKRLLCVWNEDIDPDGFYKEFQIIHPFEDGNGRIGDLLWKMLTYRQTWVWPTTLPPDLF